MDRQKLLASPVIAGLASLARRPVPESGVTVVDMMRDAVLGAATDAVRRGNATIDEVLAAIDVVITPRGTWQEADAGRAAVVAAGRSADGLRSVVTEIGVLQQSAVHRAIDEVRSGGARAVLVLGGEAKHSADRCGVARDARGDATQPDEVVRPHGDLVHAVEIAHQVYVPVQQYALIESVLARRAGRSPDEQEAHVARLWAEGSAAVVGRTDSWRTDALMVDEVLSGRVLAAPYRRMVVSSWTVDQSVALLVTSFETAQLWGLEAADVMGLVGSATTDHMVPLIARAELDGCPAFALGADAIHESTGIHPRDAAVLDLYSCFPSAVQIAARDLGVAGRPWTVTGGMAAFGGPFNSYALHGIVAVGQALRGIDGALGATTCVSGLLTKVGVAVWSCGPGPAVLHDVTEADRVARRSVPVLEGADGEFDDARVVADTWFPDADGVRVVEIVEDDAGRRSLRSRRE